MNNYREWIVQYHGNLKNILQDTYVMIDIFDERYAIITARDEQVPYLKSLIQIECMEESRPIREVTPWIDPTQIISMEKQRRGVSGDGVTVGWIGHKININYNNYNKFDGGTRIICLYDGIRQYNADQINSISKGHKKYLSSSLLSPMDMCIGNGGIASNSEIIVINWQKDRFYTADAIRALRFIIGKTDNTQMPLVIYFPFDISGETGGENTLIRAIVGDMALYGKVTIVSSLERGRTNLEPNLSLGRAPLFSTYAPLTVGALSLVKEWGIVRGNNLSLHGEKLRTYYIKHMISLLKKDRFYTRNYSLDSLDDWLKLLIPMPVMEEFRILDLPYEFLPGDGIIDAIIVYNSFSIQTTIKTEQDIIIYPLVYPYFGVRGAVRDIRVAFAQYFGKTAGSFLAFLAGNEPLNIYPAIFKTVSLLKQPTEFKGNNTLIGIIDTGIDYTNPAFIDSKGETRIRSIWDQTIGTDSPYGYGTVYNREIINTALKSTDPFEVVPHKDEWGHGTILAGIAAGSGKYTEGTYEGIAPEAELIVVKLKTATPTMQGIYYSKYVPLAFSSLDIALAVQYLADLSNVMQQPISICIPAGTNSGSHDGTNLLESIITTYGENPGICTVLSAGDEANKGHHASGNLKEEKDQKINLTISQGQGGFLVEIWAMFGDRIEVSLIPPQKEEIPTPTIELNKAQVHQLGGNSFVWSGGSILDIETGCQVIHFRIENPVSGQWEINIKGVTIIDGRYNIWIPKTGMILPGTVLSPASPFTTIYNASMSGGVITVACYDKRALGPCPSSGRGFTRDDRVKPDFMVEGVGIPGPLPDNKWGTITGTSPASAITAGICALVYDQQITQGAQLANTAIMKALLVERLKREPTISYPNPSRGYGLLDINSDLF